MTAADRPSVTPRVGDTLTTAEQLDALPSLAIVIDANDEVQQRHGHLSTERGDYSAWLGVMPPTCKPSPDVALPVTVLYVPGEPSRPSVTDNARAEAVRKVLHDETGGCTCSPSYTERGLEAPDCPWHDIERAIPAVLNAASGRAETTTDEACGDYPAPCNCDDPTTHDGATTATTEDAVGELLEWMTNAATQLEALRDEHWYPPERQRLLGKVEGVKLAASYVEEARGLLATTRTATIEDVARVLVHETTSGLCEYGRVCDECDCFADAGGRERDAHALALARALDREGLLATAHAKTTTATVEDAARVRAQIAVLLTQHAQSVLAREGMFDSDETSEAVDAILALLATARTRPTREQIITALDHEGAFCGVCGREPGDPLDDCDDCRRCLHRYADAVLALLRAGGA